MTIKKFIKIKNTLGVYTISDWVPIKQEKNSKCLVLNNKNISNNWFLLGIRHSETDKKVYGYLKINNSYFFQGRELGSTRLRWRIIHISKAGLIKLYLENIKNLNSIEDIFFIRIPFFEAIRRINYRISKQAFIFIQKKLEFKYKWKVYNRLFYTNKNNLIKYSDLIKIHENNYNFKFKDKLKDSHNLKILNSSNINNIEDNDWLIIKLHKNFKLSKIAFQSIKWALNKESSTILLYGDEDFIDKNNERYSPLLRPAWNKKLFISEPFYTSMYIIKGKIWKNNFSDLKKNKKYFNSREMFVFIVNNIIRNNLEKNIKHIPVILGHNTKKIKSKTLIEKFTRQHFNYIKKYMYDCNKKICDVEVDLNNQSIKLYYPVPKDLILSVIIPTKDKVELLQNCINSILSKPAGCKLEVIVINNRSSNKSTYKYLDNLKLKSTKSIKFKVINYQKKFNYSAINNYAAKFCNGDVLLLLNNDVNLLTKNWASTIGAHAISENTGCVGIKLIYPDDTIQHAGVIIGIYGSAAYSHKNYARKELGYAGRLQKIQEVSAVTGAFLAISKCNWIKLGGLNERFLPINYNDIDLCLKAKNIGLKNIYIPYVEAIHYESQSRGKPRGLDFLKWQLELNYFKLRWKKIIKSDPVYNPMLTLCREDWSLNLNKYNLRIR